MSGYRPDDDWSQVTVDPSVDRSVSPFLLGLVFAVIGFFRDILDWTNGGGTISIVRALTAARAKAASINVDQSGLTFASLLVVCASFMGLCRIFGIKKIPPGRGLLLIFVILAITFAFDILYGERVTTSYMAAHDYRRCPARDHSVGQFRSYVAFNNYVLTEASCP